MIFWTASEADEDIADSHRLHANGFVRKARDRSRLAGAVSAVGSFWPGTALLPAPSGPCPQVTGGKP